MEKLLTRTPRSFIIPYIRNNPGFKLPCHPHSRLLSEFGPCGTVVRGSRGVRLFSVGGSGRETDVAGRKVVRMAVADRSGWLSMFPYWVKWIAGSASLAFTIWNWRYWKRIPLIEGKAEEIMEEIETVAEVVEKVANVAEQVSEKVADSIPDDNKLKEAALIVERLSKAAEEEAQITQDIIHKVDGVKQDVEELINIGGDIVRPGSQGESTVSPTPTATPLSVPLSSTR
ncbi:hypothetical protein MLD38_032165 [Melastoma candidum]|uniref:Uncharacterized protein n=1 Tax=Melastoma candidum TaxID=119954 RepID=A0ACB9M2S2_9MYRT|nr:hypothetical protein MLD38_032165 [Melastoma candidum]